MHFLRGIVIKPQQWCFGLLSLAFLLVHAFPFLQGRGVAVLGFDTGFYRRYLIEPMTSIPHAAVPGLDHTVIVPRIFLDLLRLLGLPTDVVLYGGYVLAAALLFLGIFYVVRNRFGTNTAVLAVFLILYSPMYFHGYWFFLFKNVLALALFFWLMYALHRQYYGVAFLLAFLIPITHQSTTIFVGLFFFAAALYAYVKKQNYEVLLGLWGVTTTLYFIYHPTVAAKIAAPPSAAFVTNTEALVLASPLLIGCLLLIRRMLAILKTEWIISIPLGIVCIFGVFSLPYAERLYYTGIFFLAVCVAAAIDQAKLSKPVLGTALCGYLLFGVYFMYETKPLLDIQIAQELTLLAQVPTEASVVTLNYVAPWVHGYTTATVYAPGVFKDAAAPVDWEYYWLHESPAYDRAFLLSYGEPLYFFVPPRDASWFLPSADCVTQETKYLYRYTCGGE